MRHLYHRFGNDGLDACLESFIELLIGFFGDDLVSVVLYGSITFNDLAPGYGDLDFLAVVKRDIAEETQAQLSELRLPLRGGEWGIYGTMIEGAFLPERMLDPSVEGQAYWWGTSRDRAWTTNGLGWLVLEAIRRHGIIIWGKDIRPSIPALCQADLASDIAAFVESLRQKAQPGGLHSVDWLLTAARELLLLREGRFSSKSEAADWAYINAAGEWRSLLPKCKQLRLAPELAESEDTRAWLPTLGDAFADAADELGTQLRGVEGLGE